MLIPNEPMSYNSLVPHRLDPRVRKTELAMEISMLSPKLDSAGVDGMIDYPAPLRFSFVIERNTGVASLLLKYATLMMTI